MLSERCFPYLRGVVAQCRPVSGSVYQIRYLSQFSCSFHVSVLERKRIRDAMSKTGTRGAKRKATISSKELEQGLLSPLEPIQDELENARTYPTVIRQARNNMHRFKHCVLFTRVGSFYELYFEQAEEYGPLLGLKVSSKRTNAGPVSMAGFPFFQLDRFLKMLVQDLQKFVAISEETANDASQRVKSGGLLFDRQVKRVITPGTLIDEHFLSPFEHNYLLALHVLEESAAEGLENSQRIDGKDDSNEGRGRINTIGLAWLDLSSGDFFTQSTDLASLSSAIARIGPREIILDKALEASNNNSSFAVLKEEPHAVTYFDAPKTILQVADWTSMLENEVSTDSAKSFTSEETAAAGLLLQYAEAQLHGLKMRLQAPIRRTTEQYMSIDKHSLRSLEIAQTLRDGSYRGSLLHAVRRTSTESGARLLNDRLTSPSMSLQVINDRLDLVAELLQAEHLREDIAAYLRQTSDTLRLVQRFSFGRGDASDLLGLSRTIGITGSLAEILREYCAHRLCSAGAADDVSTSSNCFKLLLDRFHLESPAKIAKRIREAIDEDGLSKRQHIKDVEAAEVAGMAQRVIDAEVPAEDLERLSKRLGAKRFAKVNIDEEAGLDDDEVWIMRRNASKTLEQLHNKLRDLWEEKSTLMTTLRERLAARSLMLKWTPGLGHICYVKGKDIKVPVSELENARTVSSSKSTRSFQLPAWNRLGAQINETKFRIRAEEQRVFQCLRDAVVQNLVQIRRNASVLDELDVACSFATLANEHHLVRPILNHSSSHKVIGGRHMTVEGSLTASGRQFTPNDCFIGDATRVWLITGPNMAGKSTFLRQNALISILAQTGAFVPAEYAEIGLVDHVFSRVGSADNLYADQSTFMVEMLETAHILRNATPRSFVIMDEVGRGTTPEDGIAVGYAALHHLHNVNRCRALFATHFHTLADMTRHFDSIACYRTNVLEEVSGAFSYVHRLKAGVNRDSHALKVAKLAGVPESAIAVASEVIASLKPKVDAQEASFLAAAA